MKTYWLLWTYIANYSDKPLRVQAKDPKEAADSLRRMYSDDFAKKATIYVLDVEPFVQGPQS